MLPHYRDIAVTVDYSDPITVDAYRLHFLPHYARMAFFALSDLNILAQIRDGLDVAFVASGPLPEIIGLVEAAAKQGINRGLIRCTTYDLNESWLNAAHNSIAIAKQLVPGIQVELTEVVTDLRDSPPLLPRYDLVTFQNCLNEFCRHGQPTEYALLLSATVRTDGYVAIIDQTRYDGNIETILSWRDTLTEQYGFQVVHRFEPDNEYRWDLRPRIGRSSHFTAHSVFRVAGTFLDSGARTSDFLGRYYENSDPLTMHSTI